MLIWVVPTLALAWLASVAGLFAVLGRRPRAEASCVATTEDGWRLLLQRVPPAPGTDRGEPPVILGHGLMMNSACWTLSSAGSLPRALSARGFDVWLAEYRSADSATPPAGVDRWNYELDDIAARDLPAIIEAVRTLSKVDRVSWVGHSMGGIVAYRYAALLGCDALHRVVTLGTPVRFAHLASIPPGRARGLRAVHGLFRAIRRTYLRKLAIASLPAIAVLPHPFLYFSGNRSHHTRREQLSLVRHALQDNSTHLHRWFLESGHTLDLDAVTVPLLVLGGDGDRLVPAKAVRPAFKDANAPWVGMKIYGEEGDTPAFGHSDLISSRSAVDVVTPDLDRWLSGPDPVLQGGSLKRPDIQAASMEQ